MGRTSSYPYRYLSEAGIRIKDSEVAPLDPTGSLPTLSLEDDLCCQGLLLDLYRMVLKETDAGSKMVLLCQWMEKLGLNDGSYTENALWLAAKAIDAAEKNIRVKGVTA